MLIASLLALALALILATISGVLSHNYPPPLPTQQTSSPSSTFAITDTYQYKETPEEYQFKRVSRLRFLLSILSALSLVCSFALLAFFFITITDPYVIVR